MMFSIIFGNSAMAYDSQDEVTQSDINALINYAKSKNSNSNVVVWYASGTLRCCVYDCTVKYNSTNSKLTLLNCKDSYYTQDGSTLKNSVAASNGNSFFVKNIIYSNSDFYDDDGNVVFPPPPETESGLGAITTELLMTVLAELKPIILGLIVSLVGFLAFRKAWNWVLANCRAG